MHLLPYPAGLQQRERQRHQPQAWLDRVACGQHSCATPRCLLPCCAQLLTWQLPWGGMAPFKIMQAVLSGERPVVPPLDALPGPDNASFAGMDSYMQLMR